jgi:type IV pilus assembly protein PilY1
MERAQPAARRHSKTVRAQAAGLSNERADVSHGGDRCHAYVAVFRWPIEAVRSRRRIPYTFMYRMRIFASRTIQASIATAGIPTSVRKYHLKVGYTTEPTGVIQQIGSKARFGLVEFKSSSEGARMLVGAGSRQSIDWADGDVETFTTNTAAMVDAVQESYPSTWTPLE